MRKNVIVVLAGVIIAACLPLLAEEGTEAERPWKNKTELGFVTTSGNSETSSLNFANVFKYRFSKSELQIDASALRAKQTNVTKIVEAGDLTVIEEDETTAEKYFFGGRMRFDISERLFWYGSASWFSNEPAGIDDRYSYGAGLGYQVLKNGRHDLKVELGGEYVDETPVERPTDTFTSLRGFAGYEYKISDTATFNQDVEVLPNLDDSDDLRINSVTSVTASINEHMALKASYTINYDGQPIVETITGDDDTTATFEFDETDTILAVSLVINY